MKFIVLYVVVAVCLSVEAKPLMMSGKPIPISVESEVELEDEYPQQLSQGPNNQIQVSRGHNIHATDKTPKTVNPTKPVNSKLTKTSSAIQVPRRIIHDELHSSKQSHQQHLVDAHISTKEPTEKSQQSTQQHLLDSKESTEEPLLLKRINDLRTQARKHDARSVKHTSPDIAKIIRDIPNMTPAEIRNLYNMLRQSSKIDPDKLVSLHEIVIKLDAMCCPI